MGENLNYNYGVIDAALYLKEKRPSFIVRVYFKDIDPDTLKILRTLDNVELIEMKKDLGEGNMFWRFLPLWEENVNVVLVRDADKLITEEEEQLVDQWLESDKDFHIVRYVKGSHQRAIIAETFGARNQVLHPLKTQILNYTFKGQYNADQQFLCDIPYPYLRENNHLFVHDDINKEIHLGTKWVPVEPYARPIRPKLNIQEMQSSKRPRTNVYLKKVFGESYPTKEHYPKPDRNANTKRTNKVSVYKIKDIS